MVTPFTALRMTARAPTPHPSSALLGCALLALATAACEDAGTDPLAVLVAEETHAALLIQEDLPSLPAMAEKAGFESEIPGVLDLWVGSWDQARPERPRDPDDPGFRDALHERLAGPLAERLTDADVAEAHARVARALNAARSLPAVRLDPDVAGVVAEAAELHRRATDRLTDGGEAGRRDALALTLGAADRLRAVGPGGTARTLTARAEKALAAAELAEEEAVGSDAPVATDPLAIERASRLVRGARRAVEAEAWALAIRRAYYACQLLGIPPR